MDHLIFLKIENVRKFQIRLSYMSANQDIDRSKEKIFGFIASN